MLCETSKLEQRYDAVLGVLRDGFSVTDLAREFGVDRQTEDSWHNRHEVDCLLTESATEMPQWNEIRESESSTPSAPHAHPMT